MPKAVVLLLGLLLAAIPGVSIASTADASIEVYRDHEVAIEYHWVNAAGGEYHAQLTIRNLSAKPIDDWSLAFELADRITSVQLGELVSQDGADVVLRQDTPNGTIRPEQRTLRTIILLTDGQGTYNFSLTTLAPRREVRIYPVGLGSAVSVSLLSGIAEQTGGMCFAAADAEQLASIFGSISDASDLLRDSDSDGSNDYFEKEMQAGRLALGNGAPIGLMDYENPDSDGDGLLDGDEVSIRTVQLAEDDNLLFASLMSHPMLTDTDGDGLTDPEDPKPLVYGQRDMLIHQSANRQGRRKEPDPNNVRVPATALVADDLTFNDYTSGELRDLGAIFWVAASTPEFMMWAEFNGIMNIGKQFADADHQAVVNGLRDEFHHGFGGLLAVVSGCHRV